MSRKVELLLIEDDASDALLIRRILSNECAVPVNVHIARDGEQALVLLDNLDFKPDLIILDLNIPRIAGPALLHRLPVKETPVVVFSSSVDPSEPQRILALGAREFVRKSMDLAAFTEAVCGIIRRWGGQQAEGAANQG